VRHEVGDILADDAVVEPDVIYQVQEVEVPDDADVDSGSVRDAEQQERANTGDDRPPADMAGEKPAGGDQKAPPDSDGDDGKPKSAAAKGGTARSSASRGSSAKKPAGG
jgi:hypothetical protein